MDPDMQSESVAPCRCEGCLDEQRAIGEIMPDPNRQRAVVDKSKYATYAIEHIMTALKVLINLNSPGKTTPFLRVYAKWVAAEKKGKKPGFT